MIEPPPESSMHLYTWRTSHDVCGVGWCLRAECDDNLYSPRGRDFSQ